MSETIIAAIIGVGSTIAATIIGKMFTAYIERRKSGLPSTQQPQSVARHKPRWIVGRLLVLLLLLGFFAPFIRVCNTSGAE